MALGTLKLLCGGEGSSSSSPITAAAPRFAYFMLIDLPLSSPAPGGGVWGWRGPGEGEYIRIMRRASAGLGGGRAAAGPRTEAAPRGGGGGGGPSARGARALTHTDVHSHTLTHTRASRRVFKAARARLRRSLGQPRLRPRRSLLLLGYFVFSLLCPSAALCAALPPPPLSAFFAWN